jgi:eukaryotic-like serine/threonine-protein kinase
MTAAACVHCHTPLPGGSRFCPTCGADTSDPGSGARTGARTTDLLAALRTAVGDRYEIRRLLGRGGMGAVFLALDRKLDREVAIKVLPPDLAHDRQFVGRFEHEARTAAKLDHPGIIPIYAVEAEGDLHYFVMKYVQGRTLDAILASGPLPTDLAQKVLWEAACGLGHAHQRGVVHRDVKPANIMLDEHGRALLTDFGISKALQSASSFTATGQVLGTPHYMSPEQGKGEEVRGASDQYSLAVVGYQMLTGRLPFEDDSVHAVIYKHVFEQPPPLRMLRSDLPESLAGALHRALEKDPDDRFPTMEDFAAAVWPEGPALPRQASGGARAQAVTSTEAPTEISQPTAAARARPGPAPRRRAPLALVAAVAIIVLGGVTAALLFTPVGALVRGRSTAEPGASVPQAAPVNPPAPAGGADTLRVVPADSSAVTAAQPVDSPAPAPQEQRPARPQPTPERAAQRQPPPAEPAPAPQVGFLSINATPAGTIVIDGREYGDTPQRIELAPGSHVVEIRREGYVTWRETLVITSGNETRKRPILNPEGG